MAGTSSYAGNKRSSIVFRNLLLEQGNPSGSKLAFLGLCHL